METPTPSLLLLFVVLGGRRQGYPGTLELVERAPCLAGRAMPPRPEPSASAHLTGQFRASVLRTTRC